MNIYFKVQTFAVYRESTATSLMGEDMTEAQAEITLTFSTIPTVRNLPSEQVSFDLLAPNKIVFTVFLREKGWRDAEAKIQQYKDWKASVKGQLSHPTPSGFEVCKAQINVFEVSGQKKPLKEELNEIISQGVKWEIFAAEGAIKLYEEIGKHKDDLNRNGFDNLFVFLQNALLAQTILAVNKIYERPSRLPSRSIPAALNLLQNHSKELHIERREQLEQKLALWKVEEDLKTKSDQEVTSIVVEQIGKILSAEDIDSALKRLKTLRDKRIAHPESIDETELPQVLWGEIEKLLEVAKKVVGIMGSNYLNVDYELDGEYVLSYNAACIARALTRLLKKTLDVSTES